MTCLSNRYTYDATRVQIVRNSWGKRSLTPRTNPCRVDKDGAGTIFIKFAQSYIHRKIIRTCPSIGWLWIHVICHLSFFCLLFYNFFHIYVEPKCIFLNRNVFSGINSFLKYLASYMSQLKFRPVVYVVWLAVLHK